ncbi:MAG: Co2+/Mg2+ efflux protein ApaG [Bacteroidota bacterium]
MITQVTSGVKVSVETFYRPDQSQPRLSQHVFAYRITITNNSDFSIQLKRRHWYIMDACARNREVEGEGVVGDFPIIATGESFQYVSGCNLDSEIGKMFGTYLMERLIDKKQFFVRIPEFQLVVPYKLN